MSLEKIQRYRFVDGLRIRFAEAGEENPITLLLVHGLGGSIESWRYNLIPLSKRIHVIALDLPGFGLSDKPLIELTPEYYSEFIHSFIEAMDLREVFLAGHSMGGLIVLNTALKYSSNLIGLILVDVAGVGDDAAKIIRKWMGDGWTFQSLREFCKQFILGEKGVIDDEILKLSLELYKDPGLRHAYKCALDFLQVDRNPEDFSEIIHPALILWGELDKLTPVRYAYRLHKAMRNSRLIVFKGLGHSPHVEEPEKFNSAIIEFVSSII